jgi:hypothetical protein
MELSSRLPSPAAAGLHIPAPWPGLCAAMGPLDPMKPNPPAAPADPVLLALVAAWLVAEALITLLVAAAAVILTLVGWRPAPAPVLAPAPAPPPPPLLPPVPPLELLRVVELRRLTRAAGLPRLARSGRHAELLQALAPSPIRVPSQRLRPGPY